MIKKRQKRLEKKKHKLKRYLANIFLKYGIRKNSKKILEFSIKQGADVNKRFRGGYMPIEYACECRNYGIVKMLVNAGSVLNFENNSLCYYLAARNQYRLLKALIKKGLNPNLRYYANRTGLHWASQEGSVESAKVLIDLKADVNVVDNEKQTPLYIASAENHIEIVNLLIHNGAQINLATEDGVTPLMIASIYGNEESVSILLEHGAEVDDSDSDGRTALFYVKAKQYRNPEKYKKIEKILFEYNADKNRMDKYGVSIKDLSNQSVCEKIYKEIYES